MVKTFIWICLSLFFLETPDPKSFQLEPSSGYHYDSSTGFYYDPKTQYYFNTNTNHVCKYEMARIFLNSYFQYI